MVRETVVSPLVAVTVRAYTLLAHAPSLLLLLFFSRFRGWRMLFQLMSAILFCMLTQHAAGLVYYLSGQRFWVMALSYAVLTVAVICFLVRFLRPLFFQTLEGLRHGWWLACLAMALYYGIVVYVIPGHVGLDQVTTVLKPAVSLLMVGFYMVLMLLFTSTRKEMEAQHGKRLVEAQAAALRSRLEALGAAEEETRLMRHDMRHRFQTVAELVGRGEDQRALEFIGAAQRKLDEGKPVRWCGLAVLDAVFASYFGQAQRQGQLLSAGQWLELARQAREMGTLYLTLTGGEPLLYPEFWELYEALNQMGFLITLLSNGSLIDEGAMERLRRCGMPHAVKLTLYGASDGAYRRVCGVEDGFSRVERGISLLQSSGVPLYLTSTVVRENAGDLQAMYDFARRKGIPFQHSLSVVQSARGAVNTAAQSRFALADFPQELSLEALERCRFPTSGAPFALCGNYRSALWLTWNGRLQGCAFLSRPSEPWQGDLRSAWKALLDRLEEIQNPAECASCRWKAFCQRCPGGLCAQSGDPSHTSPGLCRMAERLYELYQLRRQQEGIL